MKFERDKYIVFEDADDFFDGLEWAFEEFDCEIEEYYIQGEPQVQMLDTTVIVGETWIKPQIVDTDMEANIKNYCNIIKMISYIREYFDIELLTVDINIP